MELDLNKNAGSISDIQGKDRIYFRLIVALHGVAMEHFQYRLHLHLLVDTVLLRIAGDDPDLINIFLFGV